MHDVTDVTNMTVRSNIGATELIKAASEGWNEQIAADVIAAIEADCRDSAEHVRCLVEVVVVALKELPLDKAMDNTCKVLQGICRYYLHKSQFADALGAAQLGITHSGSSDYWRGRFLHSQGIFFLEMGKYEAALESHISALEIQSRLGDHEKIGYAWLSIGNVCFSASHYSLAEKLYEQVASTAPSADLAILANGNLAGVALETGQLDRGIRLARTALTLMPQTTNPSKRVWNAAYLCTIVRLSAALGRSEEAVDVAEQARQLAVSDHFDSYIAQFARFAQGTALCASGDFREGTEILKELLDINRARQNVASERSTLNELIRVYERGGQPEQALFYLRETLELNKMARRAQLELWRWYASPSTSMEVAADRYLATREAALQNDIDRRVDACIEMALVASFLAGYDEGHIYRRGGLARLIAGAAGWDDQRKRDIELAAQLIDIGMVAIPDRLLLKPSTLSDDEHRLVCEHTSFGAEMLRRANLAALKTAVLTATHHHERWNGCGSPSGLSGTAIPIEARLIALCDVFEAMTHDRPWREAIPINEALNQIANLAGDWFDPELTGMFLKSLREVLSITDDLNTFLAGDTQPSAFASARKLLSRLEKSPATA